MTAAVLADLVAAYNRHEEALRQRSHVLTIETVRAAVEAAARDCGMTYAAARDAMSSYWAGMRG